MRSAYNAHSDLVMEYLSRNRFTSKRPFPFLLSYFSNVVNLENNGTSHQFIFEQVHYKIFRLHRRLRTAYVDYAVVYARGQLLA